MRKGEHCTFDGCVDLLVFLNAREEYFLLNTLSVFALD